MTAFEHSVHALDAVLRLPRPQSRFIELDEDPFAMNLIRGNPIRLAARKARHLWSLIGVARFLGGFHAGEA